jgi:predicted nucleic acid-binding protein
MAEYLPDTNIFIAIFKGDAKLKTLIENSDSAINTIVYLELIQGAKDKAEIDKIEKYLIQFELIHFDKAVSQKAIELVRNHSKSHGLMLPDAIIAASCLENDLTLITFNVKDFRFIDGLKLLTP